MGVYKNQMRTRTNAIAHLALLGVTLFYSGNYIIAQDVMQGGFIPPKAFVVFRVFGAGLLFWLLSRLFIREKLRREDVPYFLLCAFIGIVLAQFTFFIGLERTPTINASLLVSATPVNVAIFSVFLLKEKLTAYKIIGMVLAGCGAILLLSGRGQFEFKSEYFTGNLLIIINTITYGLYLVLIRPLVMKYHPITVIKWVFTFSMPFVGWYGWKSVGEIEWTSFNQYAWIGLAYVIIFATFLTYSLNAFAIRALSPVVVGLYLYLQPFLTTLFSIAFEKDTLDGYKVISGLLIFSGLYFAAIRRKVK